jgi:DNA polymerase-3 subunit delta
VPSDDLLVPLTLVVGDEELLVSRAVSDVVSAARAADPEVDVRDLTAGDLQRGDLDEVLSPSLFGDRRVVVLRCAQDLVKDLTPELTNYVADPLPRCRSSSCTPAAPRARPC